jgi:hypothetical protein
MDSTAPRVVTVRTKVALNVFISWERSAGPIIKKAAAAKSVIEARSYGMIVSPFRGQ